MGDYPPTSKIKKWCYLRSRTWCSSCCRRSRTTAARTAAWWARYRWRRRRRAAKLSCRSCPCAAPRAFPRRYASAIPVQMCCSKAGAQRGEGTSAAATGREAFRYPMLTPGGHVLSGPRERPPPQAGQRHAGRVPRLRTGRRMHPDRHRRAALKTFGVEIPGCLLCA